MRIWLFSHLTDSPGNRDFTEEAGRRGHQVMLVRPDAYHQLLSADWRGSDPTPDLVFTRSGSSAPPSALAALTVLEQQGHRCINPAVPLMRARDKSITAALLNAAGVPAPATVLLGKEAIEKAANLLPGPPWVLKLPVSTKGQGVCLVESMAGLRSLVDTLRSLDQPLLLQEFIEARGADTRVIVLGGRAVIAARRQATGSGEFRSNVHLGGQAHRVELTDELAAVAESAAAALELGIAGVDILSSEKGLAVIEVNGSPGLAAAPEMPSLLVDYLESLPEHPKQPRTNTASFRSEIHPP